MTNTAPIPQFNLEDRLRKALEAASVTPEEMADHLGVTDRTVRNYIAGRTPIKRGFLLQWAMRCGVDARWLATGHTDGGDTIGYRISPGQRRRRGPPGRVCGLSVVT